MKLPLSIVPVFFVITVAAQPVETGKNTVDSVYIADSRIQVHNLKNYTSVFIDSSNKITREEIALGRFNNRFQPLTGMRQPAQPYITYWLKFTITASADIQNWWLLLTDDPVIKDYKAENFYVDAYFQNSSREVEHQRTGLFVPRSQKSIKENLVLNRVLFSAKAGEAKQVYLRIYNEYDPGVITSPQLRNPVAGIPGGNPNIGIAFSSGGVFFFSIISFFFFFFVREKAYLFFGLYTLFLSQVYLLLLPGLQFVDWFMPEYPRLTPAVFRLLATGSFIFFVLFGRFFINLPQLSRRLDRIVKWACVVWAAWIITDVVITAVTHRQLVNEVTYFFMFSLFVFLVRIAFFKSILVRIYVAGALWLTLFTILGLTYNLGIIALPFNPWQVGQLGQLLIYAAGLAYKVRLNAKARAQAELIKLRNVELARLYEESKKQKEEKEVQKKNAEDALMELKAAQAQLIQSEKMASLGELTAGVAHEIQNPLNFVNNFSEVNKELLTEMRNEIAKGNYDEVNALAKDLEDNQEKINQHGKRADAIVKGMLQHSRTSSGLKEPTDISKLADEYFRLAYHGLRAKDKSFNATLRTEYDEGIGNINMNPQDIGRAILNLINNAFYAVTEKKKEQPIGYEPSVSITTRHVNGKVEIAVKDNGNGIPKKVVEKIFQPFFTTKPTGQGTGLGLSLAYDIVKAHGGEINVETREGEGSEFIIELPIK